jgi:pimeloyl-ACP methyl ester carboxylesterase
MRRKLNWLVFILSAGLAGALWYYTGQLLYPSWRAKDLSVCDARTESYWGKDCGNIRKSGQFQFEEIKIPSTNGYDLPGWKIPSAKNGSGPASGAVFLVHGGGSDRREESRYIQFFVSRRLDVYTFDMSCSGESPCVAAGMTFGHKESRDVQSVYAFLKPLYPRVYAMGTSVGATSILIALPGMAELSAVIAENPMFSFQRFVDETPAAPSFLPGWFKFLVVSIAKKRGLFDGLSSAQNSLRIANSYLYISKAMDLFDASEGKHLSEKFFELDAKLLVLAFKSDWLYPAYQSLDIVTACKVSGVPVSKRVPRCQRKKAA